ALAPEKHIFSNLYLSMIRVGEVSGSLPVMLGRLSTMLERDQALTRKLRSALAYPAFVLTFALLIVWAMMAFIMPTFIPIFKSAGLNLPHDSPITQVLINASQAATNPIVLVAVVGGFILLALGIRILRAREEGRLLIDTFRFHLPFLSGMIHVAVLTR